MFVQKCKFLQLSLEMQFFNFLVQQKLALVIRCLTNRKVKDNDNAMADQQMQKVDDKI